MNENTFCNMLNNRTSSFPFYNYGTYLFYYHWIEIIFKNNIKISFSRKVCNKSVDIRNAESHIKKLAENNIYYS